MTDAPPAQPAGAPSGGDPRPGSRPWEGDDPGAVATAAPAAAAAPPGAPAAAGVTDDAEHEGERGDEHGPPAAPAVAPVPVPVPRRVRPTSRRSRAATRRAHAAAVAGATRADRRDGDAPPMSAGQRAAAWLRGRPVPGTTRRAVERRRTWIVLAIAAAAAAGAGLSVVGTSVVRNSTAGRYVAPPVGPDEPGYQAYVVATPTLLAVQADAEGDLAAVALVGLLPGDAGGSVTLVPPSTLVPEADEAASTTTTTSGDEADLDGDGEGDAPAIDVAGDTVAAAYAEAGPDGAALAVATLLGVAIDDQVELDADGWADLVAPVGPVEVAAPAGASGAGADEVAVAAADVAAFLAGDAEADAGASGGAAGADDGELALTARQQAFWQAWLEEVADGGDEALPDGEGALAGAVAGLAPGADVAVVPVEPADDDATSAQGAKGGTAFVASEPATSELIARAVPYPLSPSPGRRVRVRLLNGTTDPQLTADVAPLLVGAGAEITIAGNYSSFDVTETTYTYTRPDIEPDAERLAEAVGVGEVGQDDQVPVTPTTPPAAGEDPATTEDGGTIDDEIEDEIDMTIVLGEDVQDLFRRLESAG